MNEQPKWYHTDSYWADLLQYDFEEYTASLYNSIEDELLEDGTEPEPITISGEPFCGCNDCSTREILCFLIPRIIQGYKDGKLKFEE